MLRDTPNFTYVQDLACPVCGAMLQKRYMLDKKGVHKRIYPKVRRPEKDGPWAPDDVLETATRRVGRFEKAYAGKEWVHTASLACSSCGIALSPGNGVPHEFADEELPHDFWERPEGEYAQEEPEASQEPQSLDDLWADIDF